MQQKAFYALSQEDIERAAQMLPMFAATNQNRFIESMSQNTGH